MIRSSDRAESLGLNSIISAKRHLTIIIILGCGGVNPMRQELTTCQALGNIRISVHMVASPTMHDIRKEELDIGRALLEDHLCW